ncbi:MAG: DUF3263 domain-containing protein [Actinomycetota bacterium]|nr:DUF3263 domain-containing protein [Actinomycetota bacterium]
MTTVQRAILDFERQPWRYHGNKDQAIRQHFGLESSRYYQLLDELLDDPEAFAHAPATVHRYRRLRSVRTRQSVG